MQIPLAGSEVSGGSHAWCNLDIACSARIAPFAIDGHRRGNDELFRGNTKIQKRLKKLRCAKRVDTHVAADFVHGLTDADSGREVEDHVDTGESCFEPARIANVTADQFHIAREVLGRSRWMDLRRKIIENPNAMTCFEEAVGEMRTDEACSSGDEDVLAHAINDLLSF
jgi:hypothetical protein